MAKQTDKRTKQQQDLINTMNNCSGKQNCNPQLWSLGLAIGKAIRSTMFVFEMPKVVHIRKPSVALLHRVTQILILTYFVIYVMWLNKGYQSFDRAISGVTAKLKGIAWMPTQRLGAGLDIGLTTLDESEYRLQPVQNSGFYLITRIASQTIQELSYCPETYRLPDARCFEDKHCPAGQTAGYEVRGPDGLVQPQEEIEIDDYGHGIFTGRCLKSTGTCEVFAWCPVQEDVNFPNRPHYKPYRTELSQPPNILDSRHLAFKDTAFMDYRHRYADRKPGVVDPIFEVVNFTVLLKNSIEFPYFKVKRRNLLPWMTDDYLRQCLHNPNHPKDRYCPKFRIGDIIRIAGSDTNTLLRIGGVLAITITWECNLDWSVENCLPQYEFFQLDSSSYQTQQNKIMPLEDGGGYTLKVSSHYGSNNESNQNRRRILSQVNGIQFLIRVVGRAGKFNLLSFTMRFGSGLALLSIASILNDMILFHLTNDRKHYRKATCDDKTLKRLLSIAASVHLPPSKRTLLMKSNRKSLGLGNAVASTKLSTQLNRYQDQPNHPCFKIPQIEINPTACSPIPNAGLDTLALCPRRLSIQTLDGSVCSRQVWMPPERLKIVQSPCCNSLDSTDSKAVSNSDSPQTNFFA